MAYRGIIDRPPSFGEQFGRGLGAGVGTGLARGMEQREQQAALQRKSFEGEKRKLDANISKTLKDRKLKTYENEKDIAALRNIISPLLEQGYTFDDVFDYAFESLKEQSRKTEPQSFRERVDQGTGLTGLGEGLKQYAAETKQAIKEKPSLLASELPGAAMAAAENITPFGILAQLASRKPRPFQFFGLSREQMRMTPEELGLGPQEYYFDMPSKMLKEKMREGFTPEEKEAAEKVGVLEEIVASLVGPKAVEKVYKLLPKAPKKIGPIDPDEIIMPEGQKPKQIGFEPPAAKKTQVPEPQPIERPPTVAPEKMAIEPLATKPISAKPIQKPDATNLRVARLAPESKLYRPNEQADIYREQLKSYPEYAQKIAADAEKRAVKLNKVLGPKALATQEGKMLAAQAELPNAREGYQKAIARVRAIESELANLSGEEAQKVKVLYDAAKKELDESEFYLKQILSNAKTGSSKTGFEQMRDNANKKMVEIAEKIRKGEEVVLQKMDYNPEFIKEAQKILKSKKLPSTNQPDDFYISVHDTYAKAYAARAKELQEILRTPARGLADLNEKRLAAQELDILKKMIQSADAEIIIHRKNLALREMQQRKIASERLRTKTGIEPKDERTQKIFRERLESAKTPQERSAVMDQEIEKMVEMVPPELQPKIEQEAQIVKQGVEDLLKVREPKAPPSVKGEKVGFAKPQEPQTASTEQGIPNWRDFVGKAKTPKDATKKALNWLKQLQFKTESLLRKVPVLGKYYFGRDFMIGAIGAAFDEIRKETDAPISWSDASLFIGRTGRKEGLKRLVLRKISKRIVNNAIQSYKVSQAKKAYEAHDEEKFSKYKRSIQKKASS